MTKNIIIIVYDMYYYWIKMRIKYCFSVERGAVCQLSGPGQPMWLPVPRGLHELAGVARDVATATQHGGGWSLLLLLSELTRDLLKLISGVLLLLLLSSSLSHELCSPRLVLWQLFPDCFVINTRTHAHTHTHTDTRTERQMDRQRDTWTDRQIERQTDRHMDRERCGQTDRQAHEPLF